MTLLCVPIMVDEVHIALAEAEQAKSLGADLVELRIDRMFEGEGDLEGLRAIVRLVDGCPLPCIVTCRAAEEGGEYDGDDAGRVALWEHLGRSSGKETDGLRPLHPPRYIDVEWSTYRRSANLRQKVHLAVDHLTSGGDSSGLILSAHDFNTRPANLTRLIAEMSAGAPVQVVKIAWKARSLRDNIEAFELLESRIKPMIALCMGEFGLMSRILAPKFGAFLTFASLRDASATAPGQPRIRDLLDLYRFRSINAGTRVYGVIGWPVGHSVSPQVHNAGFEATEQDAVYLPLPVPEEWEHFKATLHALLDFKRLDFRGASVTLPHKEHLLRFAREDHSRQWRIDPMAERCGAANTLIVEGDGSCRVMNSDAAAAAESLRPHLGDMKQKSIVVIGAGGVSRAVVAGLVDAGARVHILNRTESRARALADLVNANAYLQKSGEALVAGWNDPNVLKADAYINCTSLGMKGGPDAAASPFPIEKMPLVRREAVFFDTVYNPIETPVIRAAREHGLTSVDGVTMFTAQAGAQFEAWTGQKAPTGLFERVARETLDALTS